MENTNNSKNEKNSTGQPVACLKEEETKNKRLN